jgi:hypothetical protein
MVVAQKEVYGEKIHINTIITTAIETAGMQDIINVVTVAAVTVILIITAILTDAGLEEM